MNGVEILSIEEVVEATTCNYWLAGFVWIVVVIVGGVLGFVLASYPDRFAMAMIGCFIGALFGLFIYSAVAVATTQPTEYETHYKVTIDDSVSMNEFLDKYEILDQEGKIYTVKERE